jgi:hypothetical protein
MSGRREEALSVLAHGFERRLSVYEMNSLHSLDGLRKDPRFLQLQKRYGLDRTPDPGGLAPPEHRTCPASDQPGRGFDNVVKTERNQ